MAYTVANAVEAVRRLVYGTSRPYRNRLTTAVTASGTSVVCDFTTANVPTRGLLALGREMVYVWEKDDTTRTLTVSRGELGTTQTTHAVGTAIEINPRFPRAFIADAIADEIRSWEPDLFQVADVSFSATNFPGVQDLGIQYQEAYNILGASFARVDSTGTTWNDLRVNFVRGLDIGTYASGIGLNMLAPTGYSTPTDVRVSLAMPFDLDLTNDTTDLVDQIGLQRSMVDLAVWGAAIRLLASAEISRTDPTAQGQARDATQVRVGDQVQVAAALQRKYDKRFSEEVAKMQRRYPNRMA